MNADSITFHRTGYGHGVGMSQAGANRMAADGQEYTAILSHYYPGTQLEKQ
jgi:stage II sporulation protein D